MNTLYLVIFKGAHVNGFKFVVLDFQKEKKTIKRYINVCGLGVCNIICYCYFINCNKIEDINCII